MKKAFSLLFVLLYSLSFSQNGNETQFSVSDVKIAPTSLKTDSSKYVFDNKLEHKILFFPQEQRRLTLVHANGNGLIETIQECYDNHRPLVLSPDIIWLAICQGASLHINEKYDSLKNVIFKNDKPDKLPVRNDSLHSNPKYWKEFIDSLSYKTIQYTKSDYYNFFVANYSTTGAIERTAYQITLLESYKKGFEYVGESGCGIPFIKLKGTKADWILIKQKLKHLDQIGLANWAKNLEPIMDEFINATDGNINKEFWQSIYKNAHEYGAFYISGWIIKFFPYKKTRAYDGTYDDERGSRAEEVYKPNEFIDGNFYLESTLSTDNFPSGLSKIDVKWNNHFNDKTKNILVFSGFFAIKQHPDKSLEPLISWAICEKNIKAKNHVLKTKEDIKTTHGLDFWSPTICTKPLNYAVYDIKTHTTQKASLTFIKTLLEDSLKTLTPKEKIQIEFVVYSNGTVGHFTFKNNKNIPAQHQIKRIISTLPKAWMPALTNIGDVMDFFDPPPTNKKVKVNSKMKISLFE